MYRVSVIKENHITVMIAIVFIIFFLERNVVKKPTENKINEVT